MPTAGVHARTMTQPIHLVASQNCAISHPLVNYLGEHGEYDESALIRPRCSIAFESFTEMAHIGLMRVLSPYQPSATHPVLCSEQKLRNFRTPYLTKSIREYSHLGDFSQFI